MQSKDLFAMIAAGAMLGLGAAMSGCEEDTTLDEGVDRTREGIQDTTEDIDEGLDGTRDDVDTTTPDTTEPNQTEPGQTQPEEEPTSPTMPRPGQG